MADDKKKANTINDPHTTMRVRMDRFDKGTTALIYSITFGIFVLWVIAVSSVIGGGGVVSAIAAGVATLAGFVWFYIFFLGRYLRITLTFAIAMFGIIWGLAVVPKSLTGGGEGDVRMGGKIKMDVVKRKYEDLPPPPSIDEPPETPKGLEAKGNVGTVPLPVPDEEAEAETIADAGPGVEEGDLEGAEIEVVDEVIGEEDWEYVHFDVEYSEPPLMTHEAKPFYPEIAKASRMEADVVLFVYITPDGSVKNVQVQSSSGLPAMDQEAVKAAYKCRFKPATQQGVPVGVWYTIVMEFRIY